ncbi:MAG: NUDIX hydrolase, partial [Candidatus Firestonebacteria bacterium]|nr:NUDIX hydrolase [Candidatus Firestonebacteria bacterium]
LRPARRELREETGYAARRWQALGNFYSSPGFCRETLRLFLARDLVRQGDLQLDADEQVTPEIFSRRSLARLLKHGELEDAKTALALQLAAKQLHWPAF